jgi:uncharacterized membrane protein
LLAWGFVAARATSAVLLWTPPAALRPLSWALLLPSLVLLAAAYLPGRIRTLAGGHPMLAGTALWALAHLLVNGMLHEVLLFGGFLVWAVGVRLSFVRRAARPIATAPPSPYNDALAIAVGVGLYAILVVGAHRWLFGVTPIPALDGF